MLQGMGHTWLWIDGFEWRGVRTKRFTYAVERSDGHELLFDNVADPLQMKNLVHNAAYIAERADLQERMFARMSKLKDEFHDCTWYGSNWTKDRIVLRGARG